MVKELHYSKLKKSVDGLNFDTTSELEPLAGIFGQERSVNNLCFALSVNKNNFNVYLAGDSDTGKTTFAKEIAQSLAKDMNTPCDLCYVYNFSDPQSPSVLCLEKGFGKKLLNDMKELTYRLKVELTNIFASEEYESSKTAILKTFGEKKEALIKEVTIIAKEKNFGVKTTGSGIYFMPIINNEIISEEDFDALSEEDKSEVLLYSDEIQIYATKAMNEIKKHEAKANKEITKLDNSYAIFTVGYFVNNLVEKYLEFDDVVRYLLEVKEDILENIDLFTEQESEDDSLQSILPWYNKKSSADELLRYSVNVLIDNSELIGAPVVYEVNPTMQSLLGEISYDNDFGGLSAHFINIKPGAFHKANGGFLIIQAQDLLFSPQAYESIRRVLLTNEVAIEPIRDHGSVSVVSSIKPQTAKINVKVILVGSPYYYELLSTYDDRFKKMFRFYTEFDYQVDGSNDNYFQMARFIKAFVNENNCPNFDLPAVKKVIEFAIKLSDSSKKISTRFGVVKELLTEVAEIAKRENVNLISECHVEQVIEQREFIKEMYKEKLYRLVEDEVILLETDGERVGQINGLAVLDYFDHSIGIPARITATTYAGKDGIINIEAEAEMSGNIHTKGTFVLAGYLGQTYAQNFPLSLTCSVCFEQNYSGVDGDSASSTELYAIMSSLSECPINQGIAVTGSVNQLGVVQCIGGVSEKIEGFYDLCNMRGLTGKQGVVIPEGNIQDLFLRDDIIAAVMDGMFHIYPVSTIDEGIQVLTGVVAGKKNENDKFPANSIHGMISKKLKTFYKKAIAE